MDRRAFVTLPAPPGAMPVADVPEGAPTPGSPADRDVPAPEGGGEKMPLLPAIVGPTGSGKSALAVALCRRLGGELISCDSMQIYRGMDIGTAKAGPAERAAVPHHLLDIADPADAYSAADYAADAMRCVRDILSRGKLPVFCGGTGLYLAAARRGTDADGPPGKTPYRAALAAEGATPEGRAALWERLRACDPESAAATPPGNVRRVVRALEIYLATGRTKSEWDRLSRARPPALPILPIGLFYHSRDLFLSRIAARVDAMMAAGLYEEVKALAESGRLPRDCPAAGAIGYREMLAALDGRCTPAEAAEAVKVATRQYAKRQLTWFRADPTVRWLACDREDGTPRPPQDLLAEAEALYLTEKNKFYIAEKETSHETE